jgi:hypothetical protein
MYLSAGALLDLGQREQGRALLERALQLAPSDPSVLYNAACFYALADDSERALTALSACLQGGWGNKEWIAHDPDFDRIRDDPRFKALLAARPDGPPGGS